MGKLISGSLVIIILSAVSFFAQGVPAPHKIRLQPFISSGLSAPVFMTSARDGTNRLFIVEQGGIIKVVQPGSTTPTVFLNITSRVLSGGERGLLGLAFHPQYSTNRRFFVYYTRQTDGAIQIAEYLASTGNPNVADDTEKIIITIPHPGNSNHNGGTVVFGPDGYLYAGPGDGGSGNDPPNNAQNINQLLGKIIRIDINNQPPLPAPQYTSPSTNPFFGAIPGADEIYSVGLRNPYRFSFDRGAPNHLWVADVGQDSWEEVSIVQVAGRNLGWRIFEGTQCTGLDPCNPPANYVPPVLQYSSSGAGNPRCSITGGYVYQGTLRSFPNGGMYVYGDYCSGEIWMWNGGQPTLLLGSTRNIVGFAEDESGEIYVIGQAGGTIEKIVRDKAPADRDGDLRSDFGVYRQSGQSYWYFLNSSNSTISSEQFGGPDDQPVPEDYNGDGVVDLAVFAPNGGIWAYLRCISCLTIDYWGAPGDIPVQGDYDGDANADLAVYRPSTGTWYIKRSSDGGSLIVPFGLADDKPVSGDYDGDGKYDIAVWRPTDGVWYRINSTTGSFAAFQWGLGGDVPAQGDFDLDGKLDFCVFRPSTGVWYRRLSSNGSVQAVQWGLNEDIPVVGDYDGDGRDDIAIFRPSGGLWYVLQSSNGAGLGTHWGQSGDVPVPGRDTP